MPIDTKNYIARKYLEISQYKSIDHISVKELVQCCGISRQAFYYHFQDIFEVAAFANEIRVKEILAASQDADDLATAVRIFIAFFSENLSTTRLQLESQKYRQFESLLTQMIRIYLKELVRKSSRALTPDDLERGIEFCTGGFYQSLMLYAGKSSEEDQLLADHLTKMLRGNLSLFN